MVPGGMVLERLETIRTRYPIVFHGVGMSLGSVDPLDWRYLAALKALVDRFEPRYVSDHLCWTSFGQRYVHELLPLPYHEEAVKHVVSRIKAVQDYLGQQILVENVSSYFTYAVSEMPEWEFLNTIAEQADCFILLDVNNIYVSAHNHGFDPRVYLSAINRLRVKQYHLAGYLDCGEYLIDTHGAHVSEPVCDLYKAALDSIGDVPVCIEWDNDVPEFPVLLQEMAKIRNIRDV